MRIAKQNQNGFTLVELLVVVAIIGIMTGIASLGMDFVRREKVSSATKELLADLVKTRMDALVTRPTTSIRGFGIRFDTSSYTTFAFNDENGNFGYAGTSEELNPKPRAISDSLTIEIIDDYPEHKVVIYNNFGVPARYKPNGDFQDGATGMVILIKNASINFGKCINVATSRIREGAWNAGSSKCTEK